MSQPTTATLASEIVKDVGGPSNIESLTHCATRLRFQLHDGSRVDRAALDATNGVMGTVPQSGDRFQVVIGGAVSTVYTDIMNLPEMASDAPRAPKSDADVKAEIRAKGRGRYAWVDSFFEYLSDSFRPLLGVLLGASLIIAIASMLDAFEVIDFQADNKTATWVFVDAMWRSVLYFLPIMVAYNAAKKLAIDPWVGAAIMAAVMTPNFTGMLATNAQGVATTPGVTCSVNSTLGTTSCVADVFGLPMQLNEYGGQVFVPLIMVALLALLYKGLRRIFPENVQLVFVPFFSMLIMIPLTAFLIGPLGVWLGSGIGSGLAWLNGHAPIVFAIIIPLLYPFLVPLGLHWPLNALMLANIKSLGSDFIQGPMGAWNFACFGATAGVLVLAIRYREQTMRQTATGALAAGLLGGISEPSLYGIHLRFKRIYPRMLVGCLVGGLIVGLLGGVTTGAFAFTSLLTIPVFSPMAVYIIAITAAFFVSMLLVIFSDYMSPAERAAQIAARKEAEAGAAPALGTAAPAGTAAAADTAPAAVAAPVAAGAGAAAGGASSASTQAPAATQGTPPVTDTAASSGTAELVIDAPVDGEVIALDEVSDPVFSSRALGEGVGIRPRDGRIVSPAAGELITVAGTGHAFGIRTDGGAEVLVHIGIDTVQMDGAGFDVKVSQGQHVAAGELLAQVDLEAIEKAGHPTVTLMTVTNTSAFAAVTPTVGVRVQAGDPVLTVTR